MDLNDAVFGVEVNEHLVHMAVVAQLANKRQGTQKAKTRSEVSGAAKDYLLTFTVSLIVTKDFLGPGTAPFTRSRLYTLAQEIKADIFEAGDKVDATAVSKGKGFQGAIKRHGQHRGPMTHGSKFHRHQGSNGACSDPSKVFKGSYISFIRNAGFLEVSLQGLVHQLLSLINKAYLYGAVVRAEDS